MKHLSLDISARLAAAILVLAGATIAGAWIFQALGYAPCELCVKERIPYYVGVPLAALTLFFVLSEASPRLLKTGFLLLLLAFAFSTGFGIYHTGVEWHFWPGPSACTGAIKEAHSMQDFLHQLQTIRVVRCDAVALRVLGLSLAAWNAIISAVLTVLAAWGLRSR